MADDQTRPGTDDDVVIGVIGLGYVGLPLAVAAADAGLGVIGFDVNDARVDALNAGRSHVEDVSDDALASCLASGARFTTSRDALRDATALIIAVPSPLGRNREPEMAYIASAADTVAEVVQPGMVVSLESTTYPGTTEDYLLPAVEKAGLVVDEEVFVCFSPERVDPGNVLGTTGIPKVVGGVTAASGEAGAALYRRFIDEVHVVSSARAAELTKLIENTYRAVNIALINELTQLTEPMEVDVWEVIDAAATKPFGFQAFYPGPGVGGHCIPLDPQFLAWRARELHVSTRFIDLAEDINLHMPDYVVGRITSMLNAVSLPLRGTPILGVGIAYKPDVMDDRESPSIDVLTKLGQQGADIHVLDDLVGAERIREHGFVPVAGDEVGDQRFPLAIILTNHSAIDYDAVAASADAVLDCRGVYGRSHADRPGHVVRL